MIGDVQRTIMVRFTGENIRYIWSDGATLPIPVMVQLYGGPHDGKRELHMLTADAPAPRTVTYDGAIYVLHRLVGRPSTENPGELKPELVFKFFAALPVTPAKGTKES